MKMPSILKEIHVSLRVFWLAPIVFFSILAVLIWVWLVPYRYLEYNLAVNLFTSSVFMVLTILFLNVLFNAREESEWKAVKDSVKMDIQGEVGALFNEMLNYIENGFAISSNLMFLQDKKSAYTAALSELHKLIEAKELRLLETQLTFLLKQESEVKAFSEISDNISEIQVKYSQHLPSRVVLSLKNIDTSLKMVKYVVRLFKHSEQWQSQQVDLGTLSEAIDSMKDEIAKTTKSAIPKMLASSFRIMLSEIDNLDRIGIEFCPNPMWNIEEMLSEK